MWTKIKTWLALAGTAVLGVLLALFGANRRKLRKTEEKLDEKTKELEGHKELKKVEKALDDVSSQTEKTTEDAMSDVRKETVERLTEPVTEKDITAKYNGYVEGWNDGE